MKYSKWWIALIMSVLGVALGVVTAMGLTYSLGSTLGMSGMDMLGIAFCLNGAFDLGVMIVVAVRNHKANKAAALAEAEAMVAAAKQEEVADFFPEEDTSAEEEAAPAEEVSSQETETIVTPEPVAQPETKPEPKPEPEPAPVVVAAAEPENPVFEPELPDPVLATPAKEDE
jgi:outer membrane biosynthesis protein TonB